MHGDEWRACHSYSAPTLHQTTPANPMLRLHKMIPHVIKTNLMHCLSSVFFVSQSLHVSGIFVAQHQEAYCVYTTIGTCCALQLTVCCSAGQQTVNWKAQHVPIVVYTQYASWCWATNMPETCRDWLTKKTEDKQCIKLVFITQRYRDARSTKLKKWSPFLKFIYWPFTNKPDTRGCATGLPDTWRYLGATKICFNIYLGFYILSEKLPALGGGEGLGMMIMMRYFQCALTRVWNVTK